MDVCVNRNVQPNILECGKIIRYLQWCGVQYFWQSVITMSSVSFYILIFFCETTGPIRTKQGRKMSLKIPKGNENPWIEEGQTTQWPKEKEQTIYKTYT